MQCLLLAKCFSDVWEKAIVCPRANCKGYSSSSTIYKVLLITPKFCRTVELKCLGLWLSGMSE